DNAAALGSLLRLAGYDVTIETNDAAAVGTAESLRPDAVLLDLDMPNVSGYEICRTLRAAGWGKGLLIIAITGWTRESDKAEAHRSGFDYYLLKPVDLETIDTLLSGKDRRRRRDLRQPP